RRPIRTDGVTLAEHPHGRALHRDARRPIQVRREFFIGPVRSIKIAALGALLDPLLYRGGARLGNPTEAAWCPVDNQALQALLLILLQPQPHSSAMHPEILSNRLALPPSMRHQDRLAPVAETSIIRGFEDLFQLRLFGGCQPNPPHRFLPLVPPCPRR